MKQVERGHWSNEAKEYYYAKRAEALGVRERGKTWDSRTQDNIERSEEQTCALPILQRAKPTRRGMRGSWRHNPTLSKLLSRALRTRRTGLRLHPTASKSCSSSTKSIGRDWLNTRLSLVLAVSQIRASFP